MPAFPTRFPSVESVRRRTIGGALAVLALTACVTVNVNFPEGVVQKATDDFVRDLYRAKTTDTPAGAPQGGAKKSDGASMDWIHWLRENLMIAEARADDAFVVNSMRAEELKKGLRGRLAEVIKFKRQGFLGEASDGQLVLRPEGQSKKLIAGKLQALANAENADRSALYEEVLAANQLGPEKLDMIRRSFSNSFQAESPSGTWVQNTQGAWERKP
ncbi:MAG: DUF1318 domain-containing protein [Bdellovibrionales bacterium]|nr:DUF1318 domain-containing protein [Bdellovibrionales bacterium]